MITMFSFSLMGDKTQLMISNLNFWLWRWRLCLFLFHFILYNFKFKNTFSSLKTYESFDLQDKEGIRSSQHGVRKGRSHLTNLIFFYDQVICLVDEGKVVDVVFLDFSKAFDAVCHSILLENLWVHRLDRCALCWVKNWLDVWAWRVVMNGNTSS